MPGTVPPYPPAPRSQRVMPLLASCHLDQPGDHVPGHGLGGGETFELPGRFVTGIAFGRLRARTGSLLPGVAAHLLHNAIACFLG